MSDYTWGIDGYGRAYICKRIDGIVLLCMLSGGGQSGVWMLESQGIDDLFDEDGYFYEQ